MPSPQPNPAQEASHETKGDAAAANPGNSQIANKSKASDIARFVCTIKNVEQQVGEHIIKALQHADTVAVLTTVAIGPDGQQHIVSAALNPTRAAQVDSLLASAAEEREEEVMCVGFHCLLKPKSPPT